MYISKLHISRVPCIIYNRLLGASVNAVLDWFHIEERLPAFDYIYIPTLRHC